MDKMTFRREPHAFRRVPHAFRRVPQSRNICIRILCNLDTMLHTIARLVACVIIPARLSAPVVCGRTHAITEPVCFPTPEECASSREQMCSGSKDRRSAGD